MLCCLFVHNVALSVFLVSLCTCCVSSYVAPLLFLCCVSPRVGYLSCLSAVISLLPLCCHTCCHCHTAVLSLGGGWRQRLGQLLGVVAVVEGVKQLFLRARARRGRGHPCSQQKTPTSKPARSKQTSNKLPHLGVELRLSLVPGQHDLRDHKGERDEQVGERRK
jgi:hypothetical protein